MNGHQIAALIVIGIFIGAGIGVLAATFAAIQCGFLPGVKFPWQRPAAGHESKEGK